MGLSSHQSAQMKSDVWLTPPPILKPLGSFDLDPCSPVNRPWPTATQHYTVVDDGLKQVWHGRVWCNPPFGKEATKWLKRMAAHGNVIALVPARTETRMFYSHVWGTADAICFLEGRPHFHVAEDATLVRKRKGKPDLTIFIPRGEPAPFNSGAPICLIAYGAENAQILRDAKLGWVVPAKWQWQEMEVAA